MNQDSATAQTTREPLREQYRRLYQKGREEKKTYFAIEELHKQLADEVMERLRALTVLSTITSQGDAFRAALTLSFTTLLIGIDMGYALAADDMSNLTHGLREKVSV